MKLLLDENLSPRLVELLAADFPGSTHIEHLKIRGATDAAIWAYARDSGYAFLATGIYFFRLGPCGLLQS